MLKKKHVGAGKLPGRDHTRQGKHHSSGHSTSVPELPSSVALAPPRKALEPQRR